VVPEFAHLSQISGTTGEVSAGSVRRMPGPVGRAQLASPSGPRFVAMVSVLTLVAVGLRLLYVFTVARHHAPLGLDATAYYLLAGPLARGHGYSDAVAAFSRHYVPTANFPPLFPMFLAALQRVHITTVDGARAAAAVVGATTVPLVATLGRRLVDGPTALLAAALTAAWPFLIASDGSLMSETIAVPLLTAALLATVWARDGRTATRWFVPGALFALAALTRADAPVLAVCVVASAMLASRATPARDRLISAGVAALTFAVITSPWVVYVVHDFGAASLWATDSGKTLAGANCPATYYGGSAGLWDVRCTVGADAPRVSEAAAAAQNRSRARTYVTDHLGRVPFVVVDRVLRTAGLFDPRQQRDFEAVESRNATWQWFAWLSYVLALPFGVAGVVLLLRRRVGAAPIAGAVAGVVLVSAAGYGNQRFRMGVEPALLLGAATALTALWRRTVSARDA
jgi:4-amino-4-deoxy-L-arabinose transferase-like glycosyltransferase